MRHFALINPDNVVIQVNPIEDKHLLNSSGQYIESKGVEYLRKFYKQYDYSSGFRWLETKLDGSIRHHYAGIGMIYLDKYDCFIGPKPYPSWYLQEDDNGHYYWSPPSDRPDDGNNYVWDEDLFQNGDGDESDDPEYAPENDNAGWKLVTDE